MAQKTMTLALTKSTKGTIVYGDLSPDAAIPSVYIKKSALPETPPPQITITLEWSGE